MNTEFYPLTMPQQNIYSQETVAPFSDVNVLFFVIKAKGILEHPPLEQAVNLFLEKNEAARIRIKTVEGQPMQRIEPYEFVPLAQVDLKGKSEAEQEECFREWGHTPFVLEEALVDFKLVLLSDTESGLYCKFHHIWCDGWCTGLIWSEIFSNYAALLSGKTPEYSHPSYEQYLQDALSNSLPDSSADRDFWRKNLSDLTQGGFAGVEKQGEFSSSRRVFSLSAELSDNIRRFASENGLKPYVVFMAAMCAYHYRSLNCPDVILGMPRLNRDTDRERQLAGMFVVELPLRCKPLPRQNFLQLCHELAILAGNVTAHKKYPLAKITEDVQKEQTLARSLIDASVSYQKTEINPGADLPLEVWFGDPSHMTGRLTMHVLDLFAGGGYTVFYDYRKSIYDHQAVARLHDSLTLILEQGLTDPEKTMESFDPLGTEERRALDFVGGFDLPAACPEKTVLDLFRQQSPDAVAAMDGETPVTYWELELRSNQVANHLLKTGGQDGLTAIMLGRGIGVLISALGILKTGCGFLWLDPQYPRERLEYLLKDSGVKKIVTERQWLPLLPQGLELHLLSDTAQADNTPPAVTVLPQSLCYGIYTSGTTGRPKGVLLEHQGLVNLANPCSTALVHAIAEKGRAVLAIGSLTFDISVLEIFIPLLNGVSVSFAAEEESPALMAEHMIRHRVNVLFGTPSRIQAYLQEPRFREAVKGLDILMSGGEAFLPSLWRELHEINKTLRVFNAYGPTEATIIASEKEVSAGEESMGKPVEGTLARVVGTNGALAPFGVAGELFVGGVNLARGYQNLPEENRRCFLERDGRRFYRTGDLVRWNAAGELEYLGRLDSQVKLRGLRIELSEVEAALCSMPGIQSGCVLLKNLGSQAALVGYYTSLQKIHPNAVKDWVSQKLPYYMTPSLLVRLEEMPLTRSGKIDRTALEKLEAVPVAEYSPPETPVQEQLCAVLEKLLQRDSVGIDDNFFEIGGNSLLAAKLAVEAKAVGIPLEYGSVFQKPTVRGMSAETVQSNTKSENKNAEIITAFDYSQFNSLLHWKEDIRFGKLPPSILLTGSSGFLGLHVMRELIEGSHSRIYCLLRSKGKLTTEQRLKNLLFYYFDNNYEELFGNRIVIVEGDLTREGILSQPVDFDLAINCAADVSHFSYGDAMYRINAWGVGALAKLCRKKNAGLVHISTPTIGQFGLRGQTEELKSLTEEDFYFGQDLTNDYAASKFLGEREVLLEALEGLDAKILRVGNLQGRFSDGEFQINHGSNAFTARMKAFIKLGMAPKSLWDSSVDYSPVDFTAKLICLLAAAKTEQIIFHSFNDKPTAYSLVFEGLDQLGYPVRCATDEEYAGEIQKILESPEKRELLVDIISELDGSSGDHFDIGYTCGHTSRVLADSGFQWPRITPQYLQACLESLDQLGGFGL